MTQPVLPWTPTTVRPGPSGSARAGSTQGFTNLSTDLDTNFASFEDWATRVRGALTPVVFSPNTAWLTPGPGWSHYPTGTEVVAKRLGRLVFATIILSYTGVVTSSATGDISPDLHAGTITEVSLRPAVTLYLTSPNYAGGAYNLVSLQINPDGTIYLTGFSAALTITNPGFAGSFVWTAAMPLPSREDQI